MRFWNVYKKYLKTCNSSCKIQKECYNFIDLKGCFIDDLTGQFLRNYNATRRLREVFKIAICDDEDTLICQ